MYRATISALSSIAVACFFLLGTSGLASAQSTAKMHSQMKHHSTSITGCLQKGDEAGEYSMKTADGKAYGLTSKKVKLAGHVGQKVKVRGYITPESAETEQNEQPSAGAEKGGDIDMTVTSLKMISRSCQM
ncbi:MAG: hypothetical protein ACRD3F_09605 [Acidobacteriaceae bacterium]